MKFKIIYVLCAILLFVAVAKLPSEYYGFLRISVIVGALLAVYDTFSDNGFNGWFVLFVIIGVVFNPIMPVYLYDKGLWMPIDVVSGIVFLLFGFQNYLKKKKKRIKRKNFKIVKKYNRDRIY